MVLILLALCLLAGGGWAQSGPPSPVATDSTSRAQTDDPAQLRQEIDQLKKSLGALEQRLAVQEKQSHAQKEAATTEEGKVAAADLEKRVSETEKEQPWTG
jgi:TolA-binding protein